MRISLTPGQAVTVHGWLNPKLFLTWDDILRNENLTFNFLFTSVHLSASQLHKVQPDPTAWVHSRRAQLSDCVHMHECWRIHPIDDFKADLGDLISTKWSPDTLSTLCVTYDRLVDVGLTPGTMALFNNITLAGWAKLGFNKQYAAQIAEASLIRLFGMSKQDVLRALR